jgi:hypothetical protein
VADKVHLSREVPGPASAPSGERSSHQFGLTAAMAFSILFIWYSRNTGHSFWVYWAPFFLAGGALLLGIPVYLGQRRHMSQPAPVPAYREVERGG